MTEETAVPTTELGGEDLASPLVRQLELIQQSFAEKEAKINQIIEGVSGLTTHQQEQVLEIMGLFGYEPTDPA